MIDVSYGVPRPPGPEDPLDYAGANAIERNLFALIRSWPAFESEQTAPSLGSYGYLQLDESASPADGIEVTFLQRLPRLVVTLEGEGLGNITWRGEGWYEKNGDLVYSLPEISAREANLALKRLWFSSQGYADVMVTVAGEDLDWEPDGLRLVGGGTTKILFRSKATWDFARAKFGTWGATSGWSWDEAAALRKEDA